MPRACGHFIGAVLPDRRITSRAGRSDQLSRNGGRSATNRLTRDEAATLLMPHADVVTVRMSINKKMARDRNREVRSRPPGSSRVLRDIFCCENRKSSSQAINSERLSSSRLEVDQAAAGSDRIFDFIAR
jgi:hypothetical protein